jgi:hypothetical protein
MVPQAPRTGSYSSTLVIPRPATYPSDTALDPPNTNTDLLIVDQTATAPVKLFIPVAGVWLTIRVPVLCVGSITVKKLLIPIVVGSLPSKFQNPPITYMSPVLGSETAVWPSKPE